MRITPGNSEADETPHLVIPHGKVPVAAYQAIYHHLTSKVEKLQLRYTDAYEIEVSDIVQLHERLDQVTRQYPVQQKSSECSITLYKNEKLQCSSIEKFKTLNFLNNKPTDSISYKFDFFTVLPVEIDSANDIVQRFKINAIIDQDLVEISDDGLPYFIKNMASGDNIRVVIEYSDYAVARTLQATVDEWVESLKSRKIPSVYNFTQKHSDFIV